MTTLSIKINECTKPDKAFMAMSESFFKGLKGIEIIQTHSDKSEESPYDPDFVAMIKTAQNSKKTVVDPNDK